MKRFFYALLFGAFLSGVCWAEVSEEDLEAIKKVVQSAYVDGILNRGEVSDVKKGFHPEFVLLYVRENQLGKLTRDRWLDRIAKGKANKPAAPKARARVRFLFVDAIGDAGMAKLEVHRGTQLVYTDYVTLLKFAEGWRIVTKISHYHH